MANTDRIVQVFEPGQKIMIHFQGDDDFQENDDYEALVYRYLDQESTGILVKDEEMNRLFIPWTAIKAIKFV